MYTRQTSVNVNNPHGNVLNSWKEISAYLDRGVRTVQRWEHHFDLPIHRIGKGKRAPVYTTVPELQFWLLTAEAVRSPKPKPLPELQYDRSALQVSRTLRLRMRTLSQTVAEASSRHRRQAETIEKRLIQMRSIISHLPHAS